MFSLVTTSTIQIKCIDFINKVREFRFIKFRDRQVNKFNRLANKISNKDRNNNSAQSTSNGNQEQASNSIHNGNNQFKSGYSTNKWVVNLSIAPLTPAQESLYPKHLNFSIATNPPNVDFITAIELVFYKLLD